ncbi:MULTISPECIES: hypothetical protein [unclassified Streptomyces]|uniref:hypothetical protein n=1 Tax=unclassified Streptomyces TaxID=2593676 RepID=UPI0033A50BBA
MRSASRRAGVIAWVAATAFLAGVGGAQMPFDLGWDSPAPRTVATDLGWDSPAPRTVATDLGWDSPAPRTVADLGWDAPPAHRA